MPTLYTALRARQAALAQKAVPHGQPPQLFAEVVQRPAEIPPLQVPQAKHISLTDRFDLRHPKDKPGHVVVIGAGLAGLSTAYELTTVGYKVTVLEAQRSHIGGRVKSLRKWIGDKVVEAGGELIGKNHPAWRSYASKFQLPFWELPSQGADGPVVLKGQLLNDQQSEALLKEMQKAFDIVDSEAKKIPNAFEPWTAPNAKALDRLSLAERIRSLPVSLLCMLAVDELLEGDNGVPTTLQSYLGVLAMVKGGGCDKYWVDTETHRCTGGNVTLAEILVANLKPKSLRRGCEVKTISATKKSVDIGLGNGRTIEADDVVLAVPPSRWSDIQFLPKLPRFLKPQMGKNVKFLMGLKRQFWVTDNLGPEFSSDGPINLTWESTANQSAIVDESALAAFSGGEDAEKCMEWTPKERRRKYVHELAKFYKGVRGSLVKDRFEDWPANEWAKASYAFPRPGEIMKCGRFLATGRGRLHFAGEHTCYAFIGYMEGALQSGLRVAEKLAKRDGLI